MKQKHLFSLLDQSYTTIKVAFTDMILPAGTYDDGRVDLGEYDAGNGAARTNLGQVRPKAGKTPPWGGDRGRGYTYKVPLTWNVKEGETVIVLTPQAGLKFAHVVSVDDKPDIDIDADFDYRWAVQKVDLTEFQELTLKEEQFGRQMIEVERTKQRESLLESFRSSLPEGSAARALFEQTTATLQAPPPPQAPPAAPGSEG
jgi:hypothetical protein